MSRNESDYDPGQTFEARYGTDVTRWTYPFRERELRVYHSWLVRHDPDCDADWGDLVREGGVLVYHCLECGRKYEAEWRHVP